MKAGLLVLAGILVAQPFGATIARADAPAIESTPIPKPPKPDFSSMSFLTGTWKCTSKSARRPSAITWTQTTTLDPSGYWMVTKGNAPGVSWYPYATVSTDWVTYDNDAKHWVDVYVDDNGGYGVSTAPGWSDGKIVWTTQNFVPAGGVTSVSALTITKVGDARTTGRSSFTTNKGRTVGVTSSCSKS